MGIQYDYCCFRVLGRRYFFIWENRSRRRVHTLTFVASERVKRKAAGGFSRKTLCTRTSNGYVSKETKASNHEHDVAKDDYYVDDDDVST